MQGESALSVSDPSGHPIEARVISSGRTARLALPSAKVPGIYEVTQNGVLAGAAAVNIDPRESDTRPMPIENLKSGAGATVSVARDEEDLVVGGKARPLWPRLAAAVAALLAVEMVLLALWAGKAADGGRTIGTEGPAGREAHR
jgi:hypothetical protein